MRARIRLGCVEDKKTVGWKWWYILGHWTCIFSYYVPGGVLEWFR